MSVSETATVRLRFRIYIPEIGRFIQEDPHPGLIALPLTLISKYIYTVNNPTTKVDPNGEIGFTLGVILLGALINGVSNGLAANKAGANFLETIGAITVGAISGAVATAGGLYGGWVGAAFAGGFAGYLNNAGNQLIFSGKVDQSQALNAAAFSFGIGFIGGAVFTGSNTIFTNNTANGISFGLGTSLGLGVNNGIPSSEEENEDIQNQIENEAY